MYVQEHSSNHLPVVQYHSYFTCIKEVKLTILCYKMTIVLEIYLLLVSIIINLLILKLSMYMWMNWMMN